MASRRLPFILAMEIESAGWQANSSVGDSKLIREMSIAMWGAPRIHGELLKIGIEIGQRVWPSTWSGDETRRPKAGGHSSATTLTGSLRWICSSCRRSRFAYSMDC